MVLTKKRRKQIKINSYCTQHIRSGAKGKRNGNKIMMKNKSIWMALALISWMLFACSTDVSKETMEHPNVLLIAVDDLNDWIGCLGGHPQVQTPNIDRLAQRGVLFSNAHSQSPVCNPSRASLMSGLYPETTGIYFLNPPVWKSPVVDEDQIMPRKFEREGYYVAAAGKLFHNKGNKRYFKNYAGNFGGFGPFPDKKLSPFPGARLWDWGTFPEKDELMPDHKIASWAEEQLEQEFDKPFFLSLGFMTPHVPQYAPKKWIDLYPLDSLMLPKVIEKDLSDVPSYGINLTSMEHIAPTQKWVVENGQWKPLVQTYLACVSFMDSQVGRVLDALDNSPYADNTIVVLFSDHGFHLGEKERWAKRSIWQDGEGTPLIIAGPGIVKGGVCDKPVQLLDIYPTLIELTGQQPNPKHEGNSLKLLLENPTISWPFTARSSFGPENVAIVSEHYRYIHYSDGSEELYDRLNDPHEWNNLANNPNMEQVLAKHRKDLPKEYHPILGGNSTGHKAYKAAADKNKQN
ncbi:MAG: sulfatase [Melioribacteraceae bacterium]|nr:sulfatase [Melioribacteraceae bacterium]